MRPFRYNPLPANVIFGFGTITALRTEVKKLGASRALVVTTPGQARLGELAKTQLGSAFGGLFAGAQMHTPVEVSERALAYAREIRADCVVGLGGGSTVGLCKALALRTDLPQIVVPTTYAGSEATPILGETAGGQKTTQRSMKVLPETIIYDVDLTMGLPKRVTAVSGMNAIAHAVEALYAKELDPLIALLAEDGIRALARSLPALAGGLDDREARSDALYGAWACGTCLGAVGMALHHKLCHVLGGAFNLPHAETHAIVLPHAVAYNTPYAKDAMTRIAAAIGTDKAAAGLYALNRKLDIPLALKDIGMPADGVGKAIELALASPYWNPGPVEEAPLRRLLKNAYEGKAPEVST
ncbi:MAG: maleylacetate reductase [Pseudolabrys sp.]